MGAGSRITRVFVSNSLVREVEGEAASGRGLVGRPMLHAACLILGMLAVKEVLGVGYRKTISVFKDAGWQNLPDFRTLEWRAKKLAKNRARMRVELCEGRRERWIVVTSRGRGGSLENVRHVSLKTAKNSVHRFGTDYVELAL